MKKIYSAMMGLGMLLSLAAPVRALEPPVRIKGYGTHQGTNIVYHYQVTNIINDGGLHNFDLGWNNLGPGVNSLVDLTVLPIGWRHGEEFSNGVEIVLAPESTTQPPGWVVEVLGQEETIGYWLAWRKAENNYPSILPGQTLAGFSVTVPKADQGFLNGHFSVTVRVNGKFSDYTGQIESLDTTAPAFSIALTPTTLRPPNEKLIPITAVLTVKDDYDPQPEIKLESITANEPLEKEDIKDAKIGTDDRQFKLKAKREGKNKTGRIYTVTYSATDGSGNKATATATVVVPHDERDKDERKKSRQQDRKD